MKTGQSDVMWSQVCSLGEGGGGKQIGQDDEEMMKTGQEREDGKLKRS